MNIKKIIMTILLSTLFFACIDSREVKLVKNGTLSGYENKTLGEAIDGFFRDPTWKKIKGSDGNIYVNISGKKILFENVESEIVLQYIIDSNTTFRFNAMEIDGVPQTIYDYAILINMIYE